MTKVFQFGEDRKEYDFKVLNERDARASAGIMFLLGILSLFSLILTRNLFWAELFSITFILEFIVRVFINPVYAPYMILGSLIVSNQKPEWVDARPKRFAWALGVILGGIMAYFIIFNILGPIRLLICILCLILLFTESVFGICLGCIVYKKLNVKLYKCPGGVCEIPKEKRSYKAKILVLIVFIGLFFATFQILKQYKYNNRTTSVIVKKQEKNDSTKDCQVPQWAIDIGHREMYIQHHGCIKKKTTSVTIKKQEKSEKSEKNESTEDCQVPQWAIDMGHREMYIEHHGCIKKK